jgi:hypothetical protein
LACLDAIDRQLVDDVDVLAAAATAPTGVARGVLFGEHRTLRLHDGQRRAILRCDHLQAVALTLEFLADQLGNLGIEIGGMCVKNTDTKAPFDRTPAPPRKGAARSG